MADPPPPPPPITRAVVDDCNFEYGQNGIIAKIRYRIQGLTVEADPTELRYPVEWLYAALSAPGIPARGDGITLSNMQEMFCLNLHVQHVGNAKNKAYVTASFEELGLQFDENQPLRWLMGFEYSSSGTNTLTSYNPNTGKLFKVGYKQGVGNAEFDKNTATPAQIASGQVLIQYVRVPALETLSSFTFRMRELNNPIKGDDGNYSLSLFAKRAKYSGATNSVKIWGIEEGSLRMRMFMGDIDATRSPMIKDVNNPTYADDGTEIPGLTYVYDTKYHFETRDRVGGWKELATLKIPWTGFEPADIEDPGPIIKANDDPATDEGDKREYGNGWGLFDPNKTADFNELRLPDPRKLQPYTRPTRLIRK